VVRPASDSKLTYLSENDLLVSQDFSRPLEPGIIIRVSHSL